MKIFLTNFKTFFFITILRNSRVLPESPRLYSFEFTRLSPTTAWSADRGGGQWGAGWRQRCESLKRRREAVRTFNAIKLLVRDRHLICSTLLPDLVFKLKWENTQFENLLFFILNPNYMGPCNEEKCLNEKTIGYL